MAKTLAETLTEHDKKIANNLKGLTAILNEAIKNLTSVVKYMKDLEDILNEGYKD